MIHPWMCDDDGAEWDDSHVCWEEIEEFSGPEYVMWKDKLDAETPGWKPPRQSVYVHSDGWVDRLC